nr:hypothetical protein GCM10020092_098680 [Actinoplanes digitatis]
MSDPSPRWAGTIGEFGSIAGTPPPFGVLGHGQPVAVQAASGRRVVVTTGAADRCGLGIRAVDRHALWPHRQEQEQQRLGDDTDQVVLDAADDTSGPGGDSRGGDPRIFGTEEDDLRLRGAGEDATGEADAVGTGHGGVGQDNLGRPFSQSDHGLGLADRRPHDPGHPEPGRGRGDGLGRKWGSDAHEDGTHSDPPSLSEEITQRPQHYAL